MIPHPSMKSATRNKILRWLLLSRPVVWLAGTGMALRAAQVDAIWPDDAGAKSTDA